MPKTVVDKWIYHFEDRTWPDWDIDAQSFFLIIIVLYLTHSELVNAVSLFETPCKTMYRRKPKLLY